MDVQEKEYMVIINCDTNDADYVEFVAKVTESGLEKIKSAVEKIKACDKNHNFPMSEYCDGSVEELYNGYEDVLFLASFINFNEYAQPHSIKDVYYVETIGNPSVLL